MTCECQPPSPNLPQFITGSPVDIQSPPLTSDGPSKMAIAAGCKISTSGRIDRDNFPNLIGLQVWAKVGGGPEKEGTCSDGVNWTVSDVEGARWSYSGLLQTITVRLKCLDTATSDIVEVTNNRDFIGDSGDYACQYYESVLRRPGTGLPITEVMPRYFRVSAEFGGDVSFGMLAGGLLSLNSVFLAYDPHGSTPESPLWRDVGLPPGVGGWLLRVINTGVGYEAHISIQALSETCVLPALTMFTRHWNFHAKNMLHGVLDIGNAKSSVTLLVEPS